MLTPATRKRVSVTTPGSYFPRRCRHGPAFYRELDVAGSDTSEVRPEAEGLEAAESIPRLPAFSTRPGGRPRPGDRPVAGQRPSNRPEKIKDRGKHNEWRNERRDQIRDHAKRYPPRWDFWKNHPNWARWRWNRPYRWATWAAITAWFPWGWSQPQYYYYGDNVYYEGDEVYYGDQAAATTEEYAQQAEDIATSAPKAAEDAEWMTLGVFAVTQDDEGAATDLTLYLQLAVDKQGTIAGTVHDTATNKTQSITGAVDKKSQRAAWVVEGKTSPIMETGIFNLTKDTAPALLHFSDGQTQQWLLVRMEEPKEDAKPAD